MRQNNPLAGADSLSAWAPFDPNYVNKIRASYAKLGSAGNPVTPEALGTHTGGASDAFATYTEEFRRLLEEAKAQHAAASQQMQQYSGQMDQLVNAPPPENDPKQAFMTSLMGNLSQAISPRMGGQQQAQGLLENDLQGKRTQRQSQYSQLAMKYMQAAKQAEQSGDMERSTRLQQMALKYADAQTKAGTADAEQRAKDKKYNYEAFAQLASSKLAQELASIKEARELNRRKTKDGVQVKSQDTENKLDRRERHARRDYEHQTKAAYGRLNDPAATGFGDIPDLLTSQVGQWRAMIKKGNIKGLKEAVALAEQDNGFEPGDLWNAIKGDIPAAPTAPAQRYGLPGLLDATISALPNPIDGVRDFSNWLIGAPPDTTPAQSGNDYFAGKARQWEAHKDNEAMRTDILREQLLNMLKKVLMPHTQSNDLY